MSDLRQAKRYRISVPAEDLSVQQWLESQINISISMRQLIREDIQKNGYTDVTCRMVEQGPKRGRPTNAELERREQAEQQSLEEVPAKPEVIQKTVQQVSVQPEVPKKVIQPAPEAVPENDVLASLML